MVVVKWGGGEGEVACFHCFCVMLLFEMTGYCRSFAVVVGIGWLLVTFEIFFAGVIKIDWLFIIFEMTGTC